MASLRDVPFNCRSDAHVTSEFTVSINRGMGTGKKVALLIGVGEYGRGLKPLQCPANGVTELQGILAEPAIGDFDDVIPLVDPDVGTMRSRMGEVCSRLTKHDLLLFYFTGHGIKDMTGEFYLTTSQTQLFENGRLNPGTAVEASFVKRVIGNCYAQRKVIILDCCFGAAFAEGFLTMDDGRVDVQADLGGEGWVVLTAATSRNYALEQAGEPLSVYTRYLVEGLKTGAAAPAGKTHVTVGQVHDYVRGKVITAAPTMAPSIFNGYQGEEISLVRVVMNPETTYRQKVQTRIRKGRIGPAGRRFLATWQARLDIAPERAAAIEAEVLKPFAEKQKHLDEYAETLREEIAEEFPLSPEAIQELKDLQKLWNLPDQDVEPVIGEVLQAQGVNPEQPFDWSQVGAETANVPQAIPLDVATQWALPMRRYPFETVQVNEQGDIVERSQGEAECLVEDLGNGITLEMVFIPGNEFWMGAPDDEEGAGDEEKPRHRVVVPDFCMGKFPVTQAQYEVITGKNPSRFDGKKRPVEKVTWDEAVAFCEALAERTGRTYRLPSEAEWEYACRAGTATPFHLGPTITTDLANYDGSESYGEGPTGNNRKQTIEVGQFPPNCFGLYDLHGNVWEWCQDVWHRNYEGAPTDGTAWMQGGNQSWQVIRGGSWFNFPRDCRSAYRLSSLPVNRSNDIGFRVVCVAPRGLL